MYREAQASQLLPFSPLPNRYRTHTTPRGRVPSAKHSDPNGVEVILQCARAHQHSRLCQRWVMFRTCDQVFGGPALTRFRQNAGELNGDIQVSAVLLTPTGIRTRRYGHLRSRWLLKLMAFYQTVWVFRPTRERREELIVPPIETIGTRSAPVEAY